jgi:hypothetical protein
LYYECCAVESTPSSVLHIIPTVDNSGPTLCSLSIEGVVK